MRTVIFLAVLLFVESTQWAVAQSMPCTERKVAIRHLEGKFSEAPVAIGLTNTGAVLEVLTSDEGRSWTILVTMPDGNTCLVAAGEAWKTIPSMAALDDGP